MSMRLGPQLCGRESRSLKQLLDELPQDDTIKRLRTCSNLFRVSLDAESHCLVSLSSLTGKPHPGQSFYSLFFSLFSVVRLVLITVLWWVSFVFGSCRMLDTHTSFF